MKHLFITLSLLLMQYICFSQTDPCNTNGYITKNKEDSVHLAGFKKTRDAAKRERHNFYDLVRYTDNNLRLDTTPVAIKMSAMLDLAKSVQAEKANIRGLKVWLGLSDNHIVFFFQPVVMTYSVVGYLNYHVDDNYPLYKYNSSTDVFDTVKAADTINVLAAYKNDIRIENYSNPGHFDPLNQGGGSWTRDTKSVIFSFQEIFWAYGADATQSGSDYYCHKLYFYNGAATYYHHIGGSKKYKHNIFITPRLLEEIDPGNVATGIPTAGNLAHLCPPSCDAIYYKITRAN